MLDLSWRNLKKKHCSPVSVTHFALMSSGFAQTFPTKRFFNRRDTCQKKKLVASKNIQRKKVSLSVDVCIPYKSLSLNSSLSNVAHNSR